MAKRASISWGFILSSDTFKAYKPDTEAYPGAIKLLGLRPGEVMMAAAHNDDLKAARSAGMVTAYVNRPYEYGPGQSKNFETTKDWNIIADNIIGIAHVMEPLQNG